MKSSTGEHYLALDHVRALAAFMVFCGHFQHGFEGNPIPRGYTPSVFPLSLFNEGHIGVALFFVLSGYLFVKLLDGRSIDFAAFFWNRFIRLAPLLVIVTAIAAIQFPSITAHWSHLQFDGLPNGGWSIIIEAEFYLLLPALLFMRRLSPLPFWLIIGSAIALRLAIWLHTGTIQHLSYWTMFGRIDQCLLGMLAFYHRDMIVGRHWTAALIFAAVLLLGWEFDRRGGYDNTGLDTAWIVMPTIQGAALGFLIASYDLSCSRWNGPISRGVGAIGEWSYSIYLLHQFYVFLIAWAIHTHVVSLSNFYVAFAAAVICFILTLPLCAASYYTIELPFLRLRRAYLRPNVRELFQRATA